MDILGEGDGDGWLRARNSGNQEGFVPCTYLDSFTGTEEEIIDQEQTMNVGGSSHLTSQISFSSVDYTVNTSNTREMSNDSVVSGDRFSDSSASIITTVQEMDTEKLSKTLKYDLKKKMLTYIHYLI